MTILARCRLSRSRARGATDEGVRSDDVWRLDSRPHTNPYLIVAIAETEQRARELACASHRNEGDIARWLDESKVDCREIRIDGEERVDHIVVAVDPELWGSGKTSKPMDGTESLS